MQGRQQTSAQLEAGNLPAQTTPFIGRRKEIESVAALLADANCRLVTLVGPGGIGKTRLALRVASKLGEEYPDGVYLVELAGVSDPGLVARSVASALGIKDEAERSGLEIISAALRDKALFLILDNCEHLLDACAELTRVLLAACPGLCILATSREPLHTAGEVVWDVPPLSLPTLDQLPSPQELAEFDAVTLFVDRAQRVLPTFALVSQNAPAVARLCHRLDGLPLAIELAASRIRVLSMAQIYDRLDDALRLLAHGDRLAPARQQTLRATLDWSYDLLTADEQRLLQRLSVFAGTFSLEAAEAVCSGNGVERAAILDHLSSLVDKSLVVAERAGGRARRFRLLEMVGWYASEQLTASGGDGAWRDRHLEWYTCFAVETEPQVSWGIPGVQTLERIDRDLDNLRAALRWAIDSGQAETGHRLAGAMAWYWLRRGHLHESRHWLDEILMLEGEVAPDARVSTLHGAGTIAVYQGDHQRAAEVLQEAVALGCDPLCSPTAAWSLHRLSVVAFQEGDLELASDWLAQSYAAFEEMGDVAGMATVRLSQGHTADALGEYERAESLLQDCMATLRELRDPIGIANALRGLAGVALRQGDQEAATAHLQEALRLGKESDASSEVTWCLEGLAGIARDQGLAQRAARLFGAAGLLRQTTGVGMSSLVRTDVDQDLLDTRALLGDTDFEAALAAGREMSLEQAVEFALQKSQPEPDPESAAPGLTPLQAAKRKYGGLTAREREVAALVARGMSNRAIAGELVVTIRTVEAHVTHILRKLGFDSRAQIAGWAIDRGLASPPKTSEEQVRTG